MHLLNFLSLPTAVILLVCTTSSSAEVQWPHNIPRHLKYFPEDEEHVRLALKIQDRMLKEKPIGMKRMSDDEGEMFMLGNWIFASDLPTRSEVDDVANMTFNAQSALRPLSKTDFFSRLRIREVLFNRQFKCPDGTNSCSSIGAPDVCCESGTACINVSGSAAGSVGCCPQGQTCSGPVSCDTNRGFSSCPGSPNGGCCLPGSRCQGIGCAFLGTSVTFVQPSTSAAPPPPSSPAVVVVPTSPSTTTTPTPALSRCSAGWFSCPSSLGGGCCQNGRTCATGASCLGDDSPSTQAPSAPVRPTGGSAGVNVVPTNEVCPNGFYVCSAYYPTGCCRIGRDCQTTGSCILPTKTIVDSNGVVIVAPTGAHLAPSSGTALLQCSFSWVILGIITCVACIIFL